MSEPNPTSAASGPPTDSVREATTRLVRVRGGTVAASDDWLAVERPLEIRARAGAQVRVVSTTMRTPGDDLALAAGFLYAERVIAQRHQIRALESVSEDAVLVELDAAADAALSAAQRAFVTTGACGICGRVTLDGMLDVPPQNQPGWVVSGGVVRGLPGGLRGAQRAFARTGGLHAAGLFSRDGTLRAVFEDVGRHNAVDKLVGARLLAARLPDRDGLLVVSGRASFELVQKAAVAQFPALVAVGAPSSLAVDVARQAGMTLIGFARSDGFNIYCGAEHVATTDG